MKKQLTKTAKKKRLTKTAKWRIAAICLLFLLWGIGGFAQTVSNMRADYAANEVAFTVTWGVSNYNDSLWVIIDYVKVENATTVGNWSRATVTSGEVTGNVSASTVTPGQGFWIFPDETAGSARVTALLNLADVEQFNWCAYALNMPPRAVLQIDGSYRLYGTKPFTVNGTKLGDNVTTFGAGTCMISFTDFTGNPAGIFTAAPTVSTSDPDRCGAGAVTLTATASGTTTANTYTWIVGGGAPQTTTSGSYSPSVALGSTTYSVTVTNAAGCTSAAATGTITVNALPTSLSLSSATICNGQSATLTASVTNAAYYSIDNTNWQTATTFSVNPTATTYYTLYVKSTAGCTATKANAATVTVNPVPTSLSLTSATICNGQSATLTASTTNAASYSLNGSTWQTATTFVVSSTATQTYTLYAKSSAGCTASKTSAGSVTVVATPATPNLTATDGTICEGSAITFTAAGGSGSYTWSGDVSAANGNSAQSSGTVAGEYAATVSSYVTSGTVTCWSPHTTTSGTITAPAGNGEAKNACGCAVGTSYCENTSACKSASTYVKQNGTCNGVCGQEYVSTYNQCDEVVSTNSGYVNNSSCKHGCKCTTTSESNNSGSWWDSDSAAEAYCNANGYTAYRCTWMQTRYQCWFF
jgi:hypothetical protein